jgi:hypothetical protein
MFSNPLDADTQGRITNLITEIVGKFSTNFPVCYTVALVQKIKSEAEPEKAILDDCQLLEAPLPSEALKSGFLTKVSAVTVDCRFHVVMVVRIFVERRCSQELEEKTCCCPERRRQLPH